MSAPRPITPHGEETMTEAAAGRSADERKDDGGAAFPYPLDSADRRMYGTGGVGNGMSLRDYFAAKALTAVIQRCAGDTRDQDESIEDYFARRAFLVADAMLKARGAA